MELEKNRQEQLSRLLAEPHRADQQDVSLLKDLVRQYPYFQPLHLLLTKADRSKSEKGTMTAAALYTNGPLLHKILQQKDSLPLAAFNVIGDIPSQLPAREEQISREQIQEEEIFEEINEVDVHEFSTAPVVTQEDPASKIETIEDEFVLESISSSDFFAFEENFVSEDNKIEVPEQITEEDEPAQETVSVSNYDDDTLPYTFLWWLAKTRKEHQSIFQPYASPRKGNPGELQQQYVEHIFHIQSPFNAEEVINNAPQGRHHDPKEMEIIDNFLKKDPQISPPKAEQIDNENKAKKSAEDHNDLVSETLAKIYIEQMLFHKAIDTYQKLSLKFPEKSRYFADLIQSLEKKI